MGPKTLALGRSNLFHRLAWLYMWNILTLPPGVMLEENILTKATSVNSHHLSDGCFARQNLSFSCARTPNRHEFNADLFCGWDLSEGKGRKIQKLGRETFILPRGAVAMPNSRATYFHRRVLKLQ